MLLVLLVFKHLSGGCGPGGGAARGGANIAGSGQSTRVFQRRITISSTTLMWSQ